MTASGGRNGGEMEDAVGRYIEGDLLVIDQIEGAIGFVAAGSELGKGAERGEKEGEDEESGEIAHSKN